MIFVTGDTHANRLKWEEQIHPVLKAGDTMIVTGDFGVGGFDESFYDWISEQPYTVLFVDGNHENFTRLYNYPVEQWNGGSVHRIRHNLIHLMRGEVYRIEGKTFWTFGGGYSIDKMFRREFKTWWPQEMPSKEEYERGEDNLKKAGYKVDYILTHTAPAKTVKMLSIKTYMKIKGNVMEEAPLTAFLEEMSLRTEYTKWYFGHFHVDFELWKNQRAIYNCVCELESGKIVRQWLPYYDG